MITVVSKINWTEAREAYVYNEKTSYQNVATKFGVAKSTVQRHADSHHWQEDRWEFHRELRKRMRSNKMEHILEKEDLQLKLLEKMQYVMTRGVNHFIKIQKDDGSLTKAQFKQLFRLYSFMHRAIMLERTILGLPNRVTRMTNKDESYEYRRANDMLSSEEKANETDEIIADAHKLQEYLERIEKYRNSG